MRSLIEVSGPFPLILQPTIPLKGLVADGGYDSVAPRFWEVRFRIPPEAGDVQDWLVGFGRRVPHDEIVALLRADRFEPDRLVALLDFGRRYRDVQRLAPVVALGEAADDGAVPLLSGSAQGRSLSLSWPSRDRTVGSPMPREPSTWARECLFLCRRAAA